MTYVPCSISIGNKYLESVSGQGVSTNPANPDGVYGISEFKANVDPKDYQSLVNYPDVKKYVSGQLASGTVTWIKGTLIDKDYLAKIPKGQNIILSFLPITNANANGIYNTVVQ
ncbi:hypothetical protein AWM70_22300 [Paenibacillus yonginensis]|uniref:Uncharacterized protein n=1 Tax=Paenibacillus yonginensis TaxID=1462996 RepID=A0A1B1N6A9_9BACL|nr:hypothetical protein [Paenibacillus yonginensis]ANS76978.1 hypothetical protein AWM70_22300 [Paenibacillus yonginensis]